jgi:hypothetical protein
MTASKKVRHVVRFRVLFLFLFLSLAIGTGKGDTPEWILLREGSGPRALLLIRGSMVGPSEGFDSRLRALGLRTHHWSEVRRLAPRMGSTAVSSHSSSAPTTNQGFVGWPPKGSTAASEHAERGMTLGTSDTWPRLGLRSRGTLNPKLTGDTMFGALRGKHGAFLPPPCGKATQGRMKKSRVSP